MKQNMITKINITKMKKLLLLCALLIFACSSDEGNDDYDNSSNQTFLERYDGVVWQNDLFDPSV